MQPLTPAGDTVRGSSPPRNGGGGDRKKEGAAAGTAPTSGRRSIGGGGGGMSSSGWGGSRPLGRAPKWRQSRLPAAAAAWGSKDDGGLRPEGDEEVTEDGGEVSESKPELPPEAAAASQLLRAPAVVQAAASCKLPPQPVAALVMTTSGVR